MKNSQPLAAKAILTAAMLPGVLLVSAMSTASAATTYTWKTSPESSDWDALTPNWTNPAGQTASWADNPADPNNALFPSGTARTIALASGTRHANDVTVNAGHTFLGNGLLGVAGKFTVGQSMTMRAGFAGDSVRIGGSANKVLTMNSSSGTQKTTYLEDGVILAVVNELSFGPKPASPSTSIVVSGGSPVLQAGNVSWGANRVIGIAGGAALGFGAAKNKTNAFKGTIRAEPDATLGFATNSTVQTSNPFDWYGTVAFDPGAGNTNDLGRLNVGHNLKLASGVFRIGCGADGATQANAALYVHGNGSGYLEPGAGNCGLLTVDNAELLWTQTGNNRYADIRGFAQVVVTNNGCINMPNCQWLHINSRLDVADGGNVSLGWIRLNGNRDTSVVNLEEGGVLRVNAIVIEPRSDKRGRMRFNGGRLQSGKGQSDFMRSTTSQALTEDNWAPFRFEVCEKGAVFDTSNAYIYWSRPLTSGVDEGAIDGGLTVTGSGISFGAVLTCQNFYNGPTTISNAIIQARTDYALPTNTVLRLFGGQNARLYGYDFSSRQTTNRLSRVEGDGVIGYTDYLSVDGALAPSCGGCLEFSGACALGGDFEIRGDANTCGYVKVDSGIQDLSTLSLAVADMAAMRASHGPYVIFEGNYSGRFGVPDDFPSDKWIPRYRSGVVYLAPVDATVVVLR